MSSEIRISLTTVLKECVFSVYPKATMLIKFKALICLATLIPYALQFFMQIASTAVLTTP